MDNAYLLGIQGSIVIVYLLVGIFLTIDLSLIDKFSFKKKLAIFFIIWLIPFIGMFWFYQQKNKFSNKIE